VDHETEILLGFLGHAGLDAAAELLDGRQWIVIGDG
jgi:hypothetical protein